MTAARTARARRNDLVLAAVLLAGDLVVVVLTLGTVAQDGHNYGDGGAHQHAAGNGAMRFLLVSAAATGLPALLFKRWISAATQVLVLGGAALAARRLMG